jgi:hypothetical protein
LLAEQRYIPASSGVTASITRIWPKRRVRGPGSTDTGSAPDCIMYHLQAPSNGDHVNWHELSRFWFAEVKLDTEERVKLVGMYTRAVTQNRCTDPLKPISSLNICPRSFNSQ